MYPRESGYGRSEKSNWRNRDDGRGKGGRGKGGKGKGGKGRSNDESRLPWHRKSEETRLNLAYGTFGQRRGHKPLIEEGVNFTNVTLKYSTPADRADLFTGLLKQLYGDQRFIVVETNGGIGGNTLSFLSDAQIDLVVTYEREIDRKAMLERNIAVYQLDDKSILRSTFSVDEDLSDLGDFCMYFDPPWLQYELPPEEDVTRAYKADYILEGMTLGTPDNPVPIERIITSYHNLYAFGLQVPPGYKLGEVEGFTVESLLIEKNGKVMSLFIYGARAGRDPQPADIDSLKLKYNLPQVPAGPQVLPPISAALPPSVTQVGGTLKALDPPMSIRGDDYDSPEEIEEEVKDDTPRIEVLSGNQEFENVAFTKLSGELAATKSISSHVSLILETILQNTPDYDTVEAVVSTKSNEATWKAAFTHITSDAMKNYETWEKLGDGLIKPSLRKYVHARYPNISPNLLTLIDINHLSTEFMADVSRRLNLRRHLRSEVPVTVKIDEDLLESFIGVLGYTADQVRRGLGGVIVDHFVEFIFTGVKLDVSESSKSVLDQQYGKRFKWGAHLDKTQTPVWAVTLQLAKNRYSSQVVTTPLGINHLREYDETFANPLASVIDTSIKGAETRAYDAALDRIQRSGFTVEVAKKLGLEQKSRLYDQKLFSQARQKAVMEGFIEIKFQNVGQSAITQNRYPATLVGYRNDKTSESLMSAVAENDIEAKNKALRSYVNQRMNRRQTKTQRYR